MNQSLTLCIILKTKLMHEVRFKKWHSPLKSASASAIQPVLPGVFELKKGTCLCVCVRAGIKLVGVYHGFRGVFHIWC